MPAFPSLMPPWLPESLPEDYDHFQGNFNCFLGSLLLFLLANLCFLEQAQISSLWRLAEAGNFVMVNPTPLLQELFSKSLIGSQRKRSRPWLRNFTTAQESANERHCLSLGRPLGQSFSSQDSLAGWGNVTPKETYSSQDGDLGK